MYHHLPWEKAVLRVFGQRGQYQPCHERQLMMYCFHIAFLTNFQIGIVRFVLLRHLEVLLI